MLREESRERERVWSHNSEAELGPVEETGSKLKHGHIILWTSSVLQAGNIAELLVKEGFARCVDWSMAFVTKGRDRLRAAEK